MYASKDMAVSVLIRVFCGLWIAILRHPERLLEQDHFAGVVPVTGLDFHQIHSVVQTGIIPAGAVPDIGVARDNSKGLNLLTFNPTLPLKQEKEGK